jgi:hypothetical protein
MKRVLSLCALLSLQRVLPAALQTLQQWPLLVGRTA